MYNIANYQTNLITTFKPNRLYQLVASNALVWQNMLDIFNTPATNESAAGISYFKHIHRRLLLSLGEI